MHRGTTFIVTKNEDKFELYKSTEFNGGMGLDNFGKEMYERLKNLKDLKQFDKMIRDFDNKNFGYKDEIMTYKADEESNPYIEPNGKEYYEYYQNENQFSFFNGENGEYIYTSDSNYIKNMTDEDIEIVCNNGIYILKPNQIMVTDYNECINNKQQSFGEEIDKNIGIEQLEIGEYKETNKQKKILDLIIKTFEKLGYNVSVSGYDGIKNYIEIESWTNGGVDMIQTLDFRDNFYDLYDINKVKKEIDEVVERFDIDEEIDLYRENKEYKRDFTIKESLKDFEDYEEKLQDLANNFLDEYKKLFYEKYIEKELEKGEVEL